MLSFFSKTTEDNPELLVKETLEDGYLCIDVLEDFDYISEKDEDENIQEPSHMPIAVAPFDTKEEHKPSVQETSHLKVEKSLRRLNWECRNNKVVATQQDQSGRVIEIRRVNQDKQLAYWDDEKDTLVYVSRKTNTQAPQTKPRVF